MTQLPQTPDRSVLGESWVMASTASLKDSPENQGPESPTPQPRERNNDKKAQPSESMISSLSASSMSGPELVMPSIYEAPISEASWVAPNLRSSNQASNNSSKKRRKLSSGDANSQRQPQASPAHTTSGAGSSASSSPRSQGGLFARATALYYNHSSLLQTAINGLLLALILHLLVLPEIIYQTQDLCQVPTIKTLYPDSCVQLDTKFPPRNVFSYPNSVVSPKATIVAAQKNLESIFANTSQTLSPLADVVRESESMLGDLQKQLHARYPDVRNALDLEFQGSDEAVRAASWEFDSLRADLHSAIDSLVASPPAQQETSSSIARDTRLAVQLQRRAEYLDRLRTQIGSKADSLSSRFSTLDDHLEAVGDIVVREERRVSLLHPPPSTPPTGAEDRLQVLLQFLSTYAPFGARFWGPRSSPESSASGPSSVTGGHAGPTTALALLQRAATHHRPVADSVLRLSRQLDVQRPRLGDPLG